MALKESLILIFHERVEEMFKYYAELFNEENTEALHKMRVAARRLKGYLKVFRQIFPTSSFNNKYNKIRNFIKTLGFIRELDVSVEIIEDYLLKNPYPNNKIILLYLSKLKNQKLMLRTSLSKNKKIINFINSKEEIHNFFEKSFNKKHKKRFIYFLPDKSFEENSLVILPELFKKTLKIKSEVLYHPRKKAELHKFRIAAKPLRYVMELYTDIFGEDFNELINFFKIVVEKLGAIHDIDVLIPKMNEYLHEIRIYNKSVERKERIHTLPLLNFLKKFRDERRKQFEIICGMLEKLNYADFKDRIFDLVNTSINNKIISPPEIIST